MEDLKPGCVAECPGCAHRGWSMEASLRQKENWLKSKLSDVGDVFLPVRTVTAEKRWDYRGKVCLHTAYHNGRWQFGMMKRDELIDICECPVHAPKVRAAIAVLKDALPPKVAFPMAFYYHSHAQLTLVLKTKQMPDTSWLTEDVKQALLATGVEGFSLHLNLSAGRRLFEKFGWHLLTGESSSCDSRGMLYGRTCFHQLIPELYYQSLDLAEEFLNPGPLIAVADLYCGMGNSLFRWKNRNAPCLGVESSGEAVAFARINVPGVNILQGTCERRLPQLELWRLNQIELVPDIDFVLYTNPPRTGMEAAVTGWITECFRPSRIAYLSCSAGTLRRDLDILVKNGYRASSIIPFDFFPQTYHVECLVLLEVPK